eukprot:gnl/TRDRNA2_/TRDRNA2_182336_c0_seq1.p1 gnl/TRDRNA2_/TRDRNA2_182336_c0~~gnl/TRDRNA2_/TRDRNA2_182336_c0_seq1.p1  ORF type:complete len:152 (-),score=38.71 gnl/TRDRNA2_/TRDRNA2_182336_c0_seq1:91-546(-)
MAAKKQLPSDPLAGLLVELMEVWLSCEEWADAWYSCYERATHGSTGRSDRNISQSVLIKTAVAVHTHLPEGPLKLFIPEPDEEFIEGALETIGSQDLQRGGIADLEHFEAALVVIYTQLAHCAELMRAQMAALSSGLMKDGPHASQAGSNG